MSSIDLIAHLMIIPDMAEGVLKKSGIDLSIQVEMLSKKIKAILSDPEQADKLRHSITRFYRACIAVDNIKLEVP